MAQPGTVSSTRDFAGYGADRPAADWPGGARVAISIVMNLEAGSELSLEYGDERNEAVYEIVEPVEGTPNPAVTSHFAYDTRAGYWRLIRVLGAFDAPCTVSAAGRAVAVSPEIARDAVDRGHEVSAHGYRWERHAEMSEDRERKVIADTVAAIEDATGSKPVGWHTKGASSPNTRRLLFEEFGFLYDSDAYDDDLPYFTEATGTKRLIMPYAFDTNDMRFMAGGNFVQGEDFATYCIAAYDWLWREGATKPAMMSLGIHPRLIGRPGRIGGLERFLEHVRGKGGAWIATRRDIAQHWWDQHG